MQTVVLILDVKEGGGGATGVVVNRPLQGNLREVAKRGGNVNVASGMQSAFASSRVTFGGPVKPEEVRWIYFMDCVVWLDGLRLFLWVEGSV